MKVGDRVLWFNSAQGYRPDIKIALGVIVRELEVGSEVDREVAPMWEVKLHTDNSKVHAFDDELGGVVAPRE